MFRTGSDYEFAPLSETKQEAYRLAPNDRLQLQLFSNRGQRLIAMTAGSAEASQGANSVANNKRPCSPTALNSTERWNFPRWVL